MPDGSGPSGSARGAACGTDGEVGRQHLDDFPDGPGAVLRCSACEGVLMVVVRLDREHRLSTPGPAWVDLGQGA
jgi:hypothetical protein